jgi:hypothetical protein
MKTRFTPQERDAFAVAVSAVEGLARTSEQTELLEKFQRDNIDLEDQIALMLKRYSLAK